MTDLRRQLAGLASHARPYGNAAAAIRGDRRRRMTRQALSAATAALAVAGTATLVSHLGGMPGSLPASEGPTTIYYSDGAVLARFGDSDALSRPASLVVNHVLSEITAEGSPLAGKPWSAVREGGYEIVTTLDSRAQAAIEGAAGLMAGQPANLQAAAVIVEPGSGRVLAYYGGADGTGADYAGVYATESGEIAGFGRHVPGDSFMVYTLAAALDAGYSLDSRWLWTPHAQAGRRPENPVRNTGTCPSSPDGHSCSLLDSVRASLNVPLYDVTASVGAANVLAAARDAGIGFIWDNDLHRIDLGTVDPAEAVGGLGIGMEVGIGQYAVTVLDQAYAMATFAAGGRRADAHFVVTVRRGGETIYSEAMPSPDHPPVLNPEQVADLTYALTGESGRNDLAIKTGDWRYFDAVANSSAWSIGYTSALGVAVWVGSAGEERPLLDADGAPIYGAGLPTQILRRVVTGAQTAMGLQPKQFAPPVFTGSDNPPGSYSG